MPVAEMTDEDVGLGPVESPKEMSDADVGLAVGSPREMNDFEVGLATPPSARAEMLPPGTPHTGPSQPPPDVVGMQPAIQEEAAHVESLQPDPEHIRQMSSGQLAKFYFSHQLNPEPIPKITAKSLVESGLTIPVAAPYVAGVQRAAADLGNFFLSPMGLATLEIGGLPKVAQRIVAAGFAEEMIRALPNEAQQVREAVDKGDIESATEHTLTGAANILFAGGAGKFALTKPVTGKIGAAFRERLNDPNVKSALNQMAADEANALSMPSKTSQEMRAEYFSRIEPVRAEFTPEQRAVLPLSVSEAETSPIAERPKGESNASQIREAETVHGDVRPQQISEEGKGPVPLTESGETVPASQVTPSPSTALGITPQPGPFLAGDVAPALKTVANSFREFKASLNAPNMSSEAGITAGVIRERAGELAQKDVQAAAAFKHASETFEKIGRDASLDFIDRMESGTAQATPELNSISAELRRQFDQRVDQVRQINPKALRHVIQDYFPHIWKDPDAAASWYQRILGKRPLEGPKSFLRKRTIPTTKEGMIPANQGGPGLEPVSHNPIDLSLLKFHEIDRYVMGQKIIAELKDKGLIKFSREGVPPDGYAKIDDRLAQVVEYRKTPQGPMERILRGHYYAPEDSARVLNNFLSPSLNRFATYRALRFMGNHMNQAQLGWSGFHFLFTGIDAATSKLSLGIEQVTQGYLLRGTANIARGAVGNIIVNPLENFLRGSKVAKEYTKPGTLGGDYAKIVDGLIAAGGRIKMDAFYRTSSAANFWKAFRSGNYAGALLRAPFALTDAISKPLMEVVVPRMKLGIFTDMARFELEKLGPQATREQTRAVLGKVWDSVDNRMGQLVYDNLFWDKTLKDSAMLSVRSVGWNLGTVRELGGAGIDSTTMIKRLKRGEPVVTRRMAYAVSLPIMASILGSMYQYLRTGKGPQELKDYFYPQSGRTNQDGTPERVQFPTYMKDVIGFAKHPVQTFINKVHPLLSAMIQSYQNKDFYGAEIRNQDDPIMQQVRQEAAYLAKQFIPFSARNIGQLQKTEEVPGPVDKTLGVAGIIRAPASAQHTPEQNEAIARGVRLREISEQLTRELRQINLSDRKESLSDRLDAVDDKLTLTKTEKDRMRRHVAESGVLKHP